MQSNIVEVIENINIQDNIYSLTLPIGRKPAPGQFVMVKKVNSKYLLARAISVCDFIDGNVVLLYQAVGRGTTEMSLLRQGDKVELTGPIGHGFPTIEDTTKKIALVGGGIGTAPLLYIAKHLKDKGFSVDAHLAFKDKSVIKESLQAYCNNVYVITESGNEGFKGYVTQSFNPKDYDFVFCCGPLPMMRMVTSLCKDSGTDIYISMENKMGCGVGGCFVCTCFSTEGKALRTCLDGPVFNGLEVDFDA